MKALEPKRSTEKESAKLSWEETAREMQASGEDWSEWDSASTVPIRRLRGILKRKPGDKSFAEKWADHKREELKLEEGKYARWIGPRQPHGP